jgi:hypothetical protein
LDLIRHLIRRYARSVKRVAEDKNDIKPIINTACNQGSMPSGSGVMEAESLSTFTWSTIL